MRVIVRVRNGHARGRACFNGRGLAGEHIDLGSRSDRRALTLRASSSAPTLSAARSVRKKTEGNTGIDHRAQQHVAADAGKAVQIGNTHRG